MPTGTAPKNCYARKDSPAWYYEFVLCGQRFRGSTGREDAKGAAAFVEALKTDIRKQQTAADLGVTLPQPTLAEPAAPADDDGKKHITLADAFDKYEREEGHKLDGIKQMQTQHEWLLNIGESKLLAEITFTDVKSYYMRRINMVTRRGTKMSPASVNREMSRLRRVFNYLADFGYEIPRIAWSKIMDTQGEVERIRELKQEEWDRLAAVLEVKEPDLYPMVEFAILSALRETAIVTLTWDQVDFVNREIMVKLKTKGVNKRLHTVPISQAMEKLLKSLPRVEHTNRVFTYQPRPKRKDAKKLPQRREFTRTGWSKPWRECLRLAKVEDFRFHDLRHTGATRIVRRTGNLKLAQQLLGHKLITTTARYAHAFTDDVRNAMDDVGEFGRTPPRKSAINVVPLRKSA